MSMRPGEMMVRLRCQSIPEVDSLLIKLMTLNGNNEELLSNLRSEASVEMDVSNLDSVTLDLESMEDHEMQEVRVVTECPVIEVYVGTLNEYLETSTPINMLFDESNDTEQLYDHSLTLASLSCTKVRLKFLSKSSKFFLLALNITTKEKKSRKAKGHFDLQHLSQMIDDQSLSDKAKGFKRLFENFQNTNTNDSNKMHTMNSMLSPELMLMMETRLRLEVRAVESRMASRLDTLRETYETRLRALEKEIEGLKRNTVTIQREPKESMDSDNQDSVNTS